jgi:hypothetical protein
MAKRRWSTLWVVEFYDGEAWDNNTGIIAYSREAGRKALDAYRWKVGHGKFRLAKYEAVEP